MKNFKKLIKEAHLGNPLNENDEETDYMRRRRGDYSDDMEDGMTDYERRRRETSDYMNEELLKEFTLPGGDYGDSYANRLPEEQLTTTDDYEVFMEMFPRGEASRILMDPNRKKLYDQHLEWTKDSQYNNVFVHMQYHEVEHEGELYKIHQTQYYNTNYKDFRNPRFTELMISKDEKRMGTYLVDTKEYVEDLKNLDVKKRVSEGTCGYGEDGKVDVENTDKLKPAKSEMSDKEMDDEVRRLLKRNFLNEVKSGDTVTYEGEDHTVMRIEDDDLGVRIYIRPNEESYYGGKKDTFWVKPEDLNEDLQLDVDLYSKDNPGIFTKADEKVQVTIPGKFGDNEGDTALQKALTKLGKKYASYKVKDVKELNEDDEVNLNVSNANDIADEEEAHSGVLELRNTLKEALKNRLK